MKNYYNRGRTATVICLLIAALMTGCGPASTVTNTSSVHDASVQTSSGNTSVAVGDTDLFDGTKNSDNQTADTAASDKNTSSAKTSDSGKTPSYYGTWKMTNYQCSDAPLLSEKECKAALDYTITYSANGVVLNGERLNIGKPEYKSSPYTYDTLTKVYKANLGEWWNGIEVVNGAQQVDGICVKSEESFFGDSFFVANDEVIWINYRGVFFFARKS